jgi:hypothetical protein
MYPTSNLEVASVVPLIFRNKELVRSVFSQEEYTLIYMSARPRSLRRDNITRIFVEGWYKPLPNTTQDTVAQAGQGYVGPYFFWVSAY